MNTPQTQPKPKRAIRPATEQEPSIATPSLGQTISAICLDARVDALKYALRSDTGHDGE